MVVLGTDGGGQRTLPAKRGRLRGQHGEREPWESGCGSISSPAQRELGAQQAERQRERRTNSFCLLFVLFSVFFILLFCFCFFLFNYDYFCGLQFQLGT